MTWLSLISARLKTVKWGCGCSEPTLNCRCNSSWSRFHAHCTFCYSVFILHSYHLELTRKIWQGTWLFFFKRNCWGCCRPTRRGALSAKWPSPHSIIYPNTGYAVIPRNESSWGPLSGKRLLVGSGVSLRHCWVSESVHPSLAPAALLALSFPTPMANVWRFSGSFLFRRCSVADDEMWAPIWDMKLICGPAVEDNKGRQWRSCPSASAPTIAAKREARIWLRYFRFFWEDWEKVFLLLFFPSGMEPEAALGQILLWSSSRQSNQIL